MTEMEYEKLMKKGQQIISSIIEDLNDASNEHIRKDLKTKYRRREDFSELCLTLGLYDKKLNQ